MVSHMVVMRVEGQGAAQERAAALAAAELARIPGCVSAQVGRNALGGEWNLAVHCVLEKPYVWKRGGLHLDRD